MPVAAATLLGIGFAIARIGARLWLKDEDLARDATLELGGLLERKIQNPFHRGKARREFERIGEDIAERLAPYFDAEYRGLADNELRAAADALGGALGGAAIDADILFAADLDPATLEAHVRRAAPQAADRA